MPTYQYFCNKCTWTWEEQRRITDCDAPTKEPCPICRHNETVNIIVTQPPGFSFKGGSPTKETPTDASV